MGHPDDGLIRAFLDGEAPGERENIRTHLATCTECRELAEGQAGALERVTDALSHLDVEPPLETARLRVVKATAGKSPPHQALRRYLPHAASFLVLLTAGTAAALPGSPVRKWITWTWEAVSGSGSGVTASTTSSEEDPAPESVASETLPSVGATLTAPPEGVELHVSGFSAEASLRVVLVDGDRAGIFAGEGTRFRSETRRLEASDPPGDVTVEIPRSAAAVTLTVNGEVYLEKTEEGLELLGPVRARSSTEIRFGPSGGDPNAPPPTG